LRRRRRRRGESQGQILNWTKLRRSSREEAASEWARADQLAFFMKEKGERVSSTIFTRNRENVRVGGAVHN